MSQEAIFIEEVKELFLLLGHRIEGAIKHGDGTTDVIIRSRTGAMWIARCLYTDEVDAAAVQRFLQAVYTDKTGQIAVVTTGTTTSEAQRLAHAESVQLVDGGLFQDYLKHAHALRRKKPSRLKSALNGIANRLRLRRAPEHKYEPLRSTTETSKDDAPRPIYTPPSAGVVRPVSTTASLTFTEEEYEASRHSKQDTTSIRDLCPLCLSLYTGSLEEHVRQQCTSASLRTAVAQPANSGPISPKRKTKPSAVYPEPPAREVKYVIQDGVVMSYDFWRENYT